MALSFPPPNLPLTLQCAAPTQSLSSGGDEAAKQDRRQVIGKLRVT